MWKRQWKSEISIFCVIVSDFIFVFILCWYVMFQIYIEIGATSSTSSKLQNMTLKNKAKMQLCIIHSCKCWKCVNRIEKSSQDPNHSGGFHERGGCKNKSCDWFIYVSRGNIAALWLVDSTLFAANLIPNDNGISW